MHCINSYCWQVICKCIIMESRSDQIISHLFQPHQADQMLKQQAKKDTPL